jgi:hypothetical protein
VKVAVNIIYFALLLILVIPFRITAQERQVVQLSGVIVNDSSETLPYVHIRIKNSVRGTVSSTDGYYSIVAREKDTLILSSVGYKKKRFVIPESGGNQFPWYDIKMERDTIILKEATVLSWISYQTFIADVVSYQPQLDDKIRADKNLETLQEMLKLDYRKGYFPVDPEQNYRYTMQLRYDQLYTRGQYPSYSIFNPFAWAQFFRALRNGDFYK